MSFVHEGTIFYAEKSMYIEQELISDQTIKTKEKKRKENSLYSNSSQ